VYNIECFSRCPTNNASGDYLSQLTDVKFPANFYKFCHWRKISLLQLVAALLGPRLYTMNQGLSVQLKFGRESRRGSTPLNAKTDGRTDWPSVVKWLWLWLRLLSVYGKSWLQIMPVSGFMYIPPVELWNIISHRPKLLLPRCSKFLCLVGNVLPLS
jgi:hypothetical protein